MSQIVKRRWAGGYLWLALSCGHAFCWSPKLKGGEEGATEMACPVCAAAAPKSG